MGCLRLFYIILPVAIFGPATPLLYATGSFKVSFCVHLSGRKSAVTLADFKISKRNTRRRVGSIDPFGGTG